jgi:hypothetical protein
LLPKLSQSGLLAALSAKANTHFFRIAPRNSSKIKLIHRPPQMSHALSATPSPCPLLRPIVAAPASSQSLPRSKHPPHESPPQSKVDFQPTLLQTKAIFQPCSLSCQASSLASTRITSPPHPPNADLSTLLFPEHLISHGALTAPTQLPLQASRCSCARRSCCSTLLLSTRRQFTLSLPNLSYPLRMLLHARLLWLRSNK